MGLQPPLLVLEWPHQLELVLVVIVMVMDGQQTPHWNELAPRLLPQPHWEVRQGWSPSRASLWRLQSQRLRVVRERE